jgi:MFS family permease
VRDGLRALSPRDGAVLYGSTIATELLLFGGVITAVPFLLTADYGLAPVVVGTVIAGVEVASIAAAVSNGRLARHVSNRGLLAVGFVCFAVGYAGAWAAPDAVLVAGSLLFVGAGLGVVMPAVDSEVSAVVSDERRAGALSVRNAATFTGRAAGPILFAGIATAVGYRPILLFAGIAAALVAVGLAFERRTRTETAPPVEEADPVN